ncbi:hypothetical protein GT755_00095 [Herbidospora sp. NEAU-GS84]|uniref:Uncharacterized protein n=1 Tax=Herbidospora solisilvae TaxID=2696284 RepID=A0A7C9IZN7_9ACTN|nr:MULTISPECIES: hypothetical protein [Herbidospora]NAS20082.1 hypothetical protein [Herbidospora solisilvae]
MMPHLALAAITMMISLALPIWLYLYSADPGKRSRALRLLRLLLRR